MVARSKTVVGAITIKHISPHTSRPPSKSFKPLSYSGRLYIAYGIHTLILRKMQHTGCAHPPDRISPSPRKEK